MLLMILADDGDLFTTLGRIAVLVLVIYMFLFAVLFLFGSWLLLIANVWVRDKVGLLHQLRSLVESIDTALHSQPTEPLPATLETDTRLSQALQALHMVQSVQVVEIAKNTQKQVYNVEKKVEPVADRIADGVIEFRARTVMAQSMLKAFFLPGLVKLKPREPLLLPEASDIESSVPTEVPANGSSLPNVSSNVVVTQLNPPGEEVHPAVMRDPERLESEGTERSNNAPGQ
jgi:hypothetical protein